jgi:hypothetical protein
MFFFEKKNQKTFASLRTLVEMSATAKQKFFASFFQKRSLSATLLPANRRKRSIGCSTQR